MRTHARAPRTKLLWLLLALGVLLGLWFLFRPELLIVNQTVDEPLPGLVTPPALHPRP
jgi:hypothetical protein